MGRQRKCGEWGKKKHERGNWEVEKEIERGKLRGYGGGKRQKQAPEEVKRVERNMYMKKKNEIHIQNEKRGKDKQ